MKKPTKSANAVKQCFPPGGDEKKVREVLEHYENQTEEEALAEDEAAFSAEGQTVVVVPTELVPAILELLARHDQPKRKRTTARNGRRGAEGQ
jgi:hypothetical protein